MTATATKATEAKLNQKYRVVDADGHVLEPPTGLWERAPQEFKERMWRIVPDETGAEWYYFDGDKRPGGPMAYAGVAGFSLADQERARRGELKYSEVQPAAYYPEPRLAALDVDGIDQSVLYPTMLLGLPSQRDHALAAAVSRTYNEWLADYCRHEPSRLFAIATVPMQNIELAVAEIRHARKLGHVGVFVRPNPTIEERKLDDPVYEPIWQVCEELDLAVGLHPFLAPDLPGACRYFGFGETQGAQGSATKVAGTPVTMRNIFFTQAISNPFDMMASLTYLIGGGVLERHPKLKVLILEANGGWMVPWLGRLDHHFEVFGRDVPAMQMPPSDYFKRQCWISFDADESTLEMTANSPLVGADRIIWASDFPHPDAKYPGVTEELDEACRNLSEDQRARIFGLNAAELYGLPVPRK
jgi:predicted TIM-barrel fold metal-dependent hydrolase